MIVKFVRSGSGRIGILELRRCGQVEIIGMHGMHVIQ